MINTESEGKYQNIEEMKTAEMLAAMNELDQAVPQAVAQVIPDITNFIDAAYEKLKLGGRLFYIGAGTSGRLGILDASECPPTFGIDHELVQGLIAGGDEAIRNAVEHAEDDPEQGWNDLIEKGYSKNDCLIGIAASGRTPYVVGALKKASEKEHLNACITSNLESPVTKVAEHKITVDVGPEFIRGSTRLKSGTAQKLILNMISNSLMIKLGKVQGNQMVDMQLSNQKLVERGTRMIQEATDMAPEEARKILLKQGSVRAAIEFIKKFE